MVLSSSIDDTNAIAVVVACCRVSWRYPLAYPVLVSLMFGSGSRSGDWISRTFLHHGFHASSPLVCDLILGGLTENLMMLLIDLGSWRRTTYGCACRRKGLYSTSFGVNTIVFGFKPHFHLVVSWIVSRACSRACMGCESLPMLVVV